MDQRPRREDPRSAPGYSTAAGADGAGPERAVCSPHSAWISGPLIYADGGASLVDTLMPLDIQQDCPVSPLLRRP